MTLLWSRFCLADTGSCYFKDADSIVENRELGRAAFYDLHAINVNIEVYFNFLKTWVIVMFVLRQQRLSSTFTLIF